MVERERIGHEDKFHFIRNAKGNSTFDEDAVGGKESMMRRRRETFQRRKSFNENLQPLKKFLHASLGRKWDDVYSEICANFDKRKVINNHILEHLFDYVEVNVKLVDGKACVLQRWAGYKYVNGKYVKGVDYDSRWSPVEECETGRYDYYVDPTTGILSKVDRHRKGKKTRAKEKAEARALEKHNTFRKINGHQELHLVDGVWTIFTAMERPPITYSYEMPWAWMNNPSQRSTWNYLSGAEQVKVGRKIANHITVTEFKTPGRFGMTLSKGWYWGSQAVAGKKVLKRFGLVGTNAYKPPDPMSHREAAKYRTNKRDRSVPFCCSSLIETCLGFLQSGAEILRCLVHTFSGR